VAYTVAEAEVTVSPNAKNFGTDLRAAVLPEADRVGREAGDRIASGMRERLATLPDVNIGVDTTKASAQVDKFIAETKTKSIAGGRAAGASLGDGMAEGFSARGALLGSAIALGIAAAGPAVVAATGVLFGGIAAVILHNQEDVASAAAGLGHAVSDSYTEVAQVAVPFLVKALDQVKTAALSMAPAVGEIFSNLQPAIDGVTTGVLRLVQNALPGLAAAVRNGTPVFQALASVLADIGSGLGSFLTTVSQHMPALATTLSSLGTILQNLFRALGTVASAGAELGSIVLPPLAAALGVVADVLEAIGPLLPGLILGFAALKVAGLLAPMFASLAASLETTGASAMVSVAGLTGIEGAGIAAGTGFEVAAAGARGLEAAMGPIGWIIAGISLVIPALVGGYDDVDAGQQAVTSSAEGMTSALEESKGAITDYVRAAAAKYAQDQGLLAMAPAWGVTTSQIVDALTGNEDALAAVTAGAEAYSAAQTAAGDAADTAGQGILGAAGSYYTAAIGSDALLEALQKRAGQTETDVHNQQELAAALAGSGAAADDNATRLQALSNVAGAANAEINLLKNSLDALTGKAVSLGDAQVAVTNATEAAKTALEGQKDANGNLTSALTDTNGHLDQQTAAGAAAWGALTNLKDADNQLIATMEEHGATADETQQKDAELRQSFINTAMQMGFSAGEATNLANQILGIPAERNTEITADTSQASQAAAALKVQLESIQDRKITVTVDVNGNVTGGVAGALGKGPQWNAAGGISVKGYDGGGFNMRPNMSASVAQVVSPNTWRVIGDRTQDDEAFIPINGSARSLEILAQTAKRMGVGLSPLGGGSGGTDARSYVFNISAPSNPAGIAREVREAQRDLEFLHG
jgi:hypothetical protein